MIDESMDVTFPKFSPDNKFGLTFAHQRDLWQEFMQFKQGIEGGWLWNHAGMEFDFDGLKEPDLTMIEDEYEGNKLNGGALWFLRTMHYPSMYEAVNNTNAVDLLNFWIISTYQTDVFRKRIFWLGPNGEKVFETRNKDYFATPYGQILGYHKIHTGKQAHWATNQWTFHIRALCWQFFYNWALYYEDTALMGQLMELKGGFGYGLRYSNVGRPKKEWVSSGLSTDDVIGKDSKHRDKFEHAKGVM